MRDRLAKKLAEMDIEPVVGGTMEAPDVRRQRTQGKTFVLTCAQNNTDLIPDEWWLTLLHHLPIGQETFQMPMKGLATDSHGSGEIHRPGGSISAYEFQYISDC